jgi:polysaccharide pyruvyl transferase WcaK-like protein
MTVKKIVIAAEVFSANLGDVVIYECLKYLLQSIDPAIEVVPIDISGRKSYKPTGNKINPIRLLPELDVPGAFSMLGLMNGVYQTLSNRAREKKAWSPAMQQADLLVVGGGQLLMDNSLGFPVKLYGVAKLARKMDLPYHLSACGTGSRWSRIAAALFKEVVGQAQTVTLRDSVSKDRLDRFLPGFTSRVTFDPVIWACKVYRVAGDARSQPVVGLGVIHIRDANYHLPAEQRFSREGWLKFWLDLLVELNRLKLRVEIFTTGVSSDQQFAGELYSAAIRQGLHAVHLSPRPTTPVELAVRIHNYRAVIATRMHASIIANAYGIPTIGLVWDQKVKAYYAETEQPQNCFTPGSCAAAEVAAACKALYSADHPDFNPRKYQERAMENARIILDGNL